MRVNEGHFRYQHGYDAVFASINKVLELKNEKPRSQMCIKKKSTIASTSKTFDGLHTDAKKSLRKRR